MGPADTLSASPEISPRGSAGHGECKGLQRTRAPNRVGAFPLRSETAVGIGNVALAFVVQTPCGYGAVVSQAKAVVHSPRDCDETAVGRGDVALAVAVTSPRDYGAIRPQAEAVIISRRYRDETAVGRGNVALAFVIIPPRDYGTVVPQAEAVKPSRRNRFETAVGRGDVALAGVVIPPCGYGTIRLQAEGRIHLIPFPPLPWRRRLGPADTLSASPEISPRGSAGHGECKGLQRTRAPTGWFF